MQTNLPLWTRTHRYNIGKLEDEFLGIYHIPPTLSVIFFNRPTDKICLSYMCALCELLIQFAFSLSAYYFQQCPVIANKSQIKLSVKTSLLGSQRGH